jgi:flagellar hook-basal body complex protein FliE
VYIVSQLTIGSTQLSESVVSQREPVRKEDGFADSLKRALQETNRIQQDADRAVEAVVQGNSGVHEGMLALGKADLSLRLLLQVRNKALEAYKEIMRMQF